MINRNATSSLDQIVDLFEEDWSPTSRARIGQLLSDHGLASDVDVLTELIRIDIELRYKQGLSLGLDEYFGQWNDLLDRPTKVAEIAFEDFRSRSAYGHDIRISRWQDLPGIEDEPWFQKLMFETSRSRLFPENRQPAIDFSPDRPVDAFQVALESEGFQIVHQIAEGTFSKVYLAIQNELARRYVVLKVVDDDLSESRNMAMLQHTNIVPLYSVHPICSRTVICMPYTGSVTLKDVMGTQGADASLAGQSLIKTVEKRIDRTISTVEEKTRQPILSFAPAADEQAVLKPLESVRTLDRNALTGWLFVRLASALAHSHARGILHGDLKPSNVLIRNDGEPALLDFNLSQTLDHSHNCAIGGTLPYMAPECYRAMMMQKSEPIAESDIYALGVMMFQFVTGRLPHSTPPSMAPVDLQPAIEERKQQPAWQSDDAVTVSLKSVIDRCLAFSPEDRYSSAEDLRVDLENENGARSLKFATEPIHSRTKKWFRRNPQFASSGAVATLLLAMAIPLAYYALHWRQSSQQMMAAERSRTFLTESAAMLAQINVDPARQTLDNIQAGTQVLQDHGLLQPDGYQQLIASDAPASQRREILERIQRHVIQIARLEARRLWIASRESELAPSDFKRIDELIATAKQLPIPGESRSLLFLEARRLSLAKDPNGRKLADRAEQVAASSQSEKYLEAIRLLTQHRYREALNTFNSLDDSKILSTSSFWTLQARSHYENDQFELAKRSVTQSILHAPDSSDLYVLRGRCHRKLGEYDLALMDIDKAIELGAGNEWAWSNRGIIHFNRGDYQSAIKDFSEVQKLRPGSVYSLAKRAEAYIKNGQADRAAKDLAVANRNVATSVESLIARAKANDDTDPDAALQDLEQALRIDPNNTLVLSKIGRALSVNLKRYEESIEIFDRLLEIDPQNERALIDRSIQCARVKRQEDALASLDLALEGHNAPRTYYQAACTFALLPEVSFHQRGVTHLAKAVHAGYDADRLDEDEDLASLRDLPGYAFVKKAYELSQRDRSDTKIQR